MEVTINLPERVFANLSNAASKSHRRIDEVIAEKIERDFAIDAEDLGKQIAACSDEEVLKLAEIQMPPKQDARLNHLLNQQNEGNLSDDEQNEMWQLMDLNRLTTLKKAFALRELSRRDLNGKD